MSIEQNLIGKLEFVNIRKAFQNEAHHFTKWLEENIETLSERIGVGLSVVQREKEVGNFSLDLLCEDQEGNKVIIENQLDKTNHDHLGKLLTYLVNLDAKTAIWITPDPRQEHEKVIDWLNESTPGDISFYLIKVEAVKVGESPLAPLFSIISSPSEQSKEIGEKKKEWADRHFKRVEFWKGLLEKSKIKTRLFSNISPGRYSWIGTGAGKSGVSFNYEILMDWGAAELYIDHDHESGKKNKLIFDALFKQKDEIEKEFGSELSWERLDDKRASRIRKKFSNGGLENPETWPNLQDNMIDAMIKLEQILRPRLSKINV